MSRSVARCRHPRTRLTTSSTSSLGPHNGVKYCYFESFDEGWKIGEGVRARNGGCLTAVKRSRPVWNGCSTGRPSPTVRSNPPGSPIIDFFALPDTMDTNIGTFVVAGTTDHWNDVVKLNGNPIPSESRVFVHSVPLSPGKNSLVLTIESAAGHVERTASKTAAFDPTLSTGGRRLLYVDAVPGESIVAPLDGTVVIDPDTNELLGLLPGQHVRGISPRGSEIYMQDNTVVSTATHQALRTLPFSQEIPSNGFLVSPTGDHLYSRNEVVNVQMNTLESPLPVDITTGNSWSNPPFPAARPSRPTGEQSSAEWEYLRRSMRSWTASTRLTAPSAHIVQAEFPHMSDIAISPDGSQLLLSGYCRLEIYDATTYEL